MRALMALATRSPYSEEGRTAALAAVKLIEEHGMLDADDDAENQQEELEALRAEVARLRASRAEDVTSALTRAYDNQLRATNYALMLRDATLDAAAKAREVVLLRKEVERLRALPPVALHVVQPGESPQGIAVSYTGSAARLVELLRANPKKPRIPTPSGWTFKSLRAGERLRLPAGWV